MLKLLPVLFALILIALAVWFFFLSPEGIEPAEWDRVETKGQRTAHP